MAQAVLIVLYLFFPVLLIKLKNKLPVIRKIGMGIICYGFGIAVAATGLIPESASGLQNLFMELTVPLSIPLLLFSVNIRQWGRLAGKTALAVAGMFAAVLAAVTIAYIILGRTLDEGWKIAGMAIGVYTGGSANLNAIGFALGASGNTLVLTNTADMLACVPWFFFILTAAQKVLNRFLKPFSRTKKAGEKDDNPEFSADFDDFSGMFSKQTFLPLLLIFLLDILICGIGIGIYFLLPESPGMAALMLTITTLGVLASLHPGVHNTRKTFQLGRYFVMVFCTAVGSLADVRVLFTAAPGILLFISIVVYGSWILHLIFCKIFSIDTDTAIITSVAALFSPPFVPVVANELKNREIIVSGIIAGSIGYVAGNYLGIFFAHFLNRLF